MGGLILPPKVGDGGLGTHRKRRPEFLRAEEVPALFRLEDYFGFTEVAQDVIQGDPVVRKELFSDGFEVFKACCGLAEVVDHANAFMPVNFRIIARKQYRSAELDIGEGKS